MSNYIANDEDYTMAMLTASDDFCHKKVAIFTQKVKLNLFSRFFVFFFLSKVWQEKS